jgi:hypothetical protein
MTIEEKISKLIALGGKINVAAVHDRIQGYYPEYNEILIAAGWEEEQLNNTLDEKIEFLEKRPWLKFIKDLKNKE